jgi:sodium/pantothenate symporter
MIILGAYISKSAATAREKNFAGDYYVGGRQLGGFVFAMTLVATYISVSTFVAAPGLSWGGGFSWAYFGVMLCATSITIMGVCGKRLNMVARRTNSVTVVDLIRNRYNSVAVSNVSAVFIVVFFVAFIVGQYVGGGTLFAYATGMNYKLGMVMFVGAVTIYTFIGGFKAVAVTDTICAMTMIAGVVGIIAFTLYHGGGISGIMTSIESTQDAEYFTFLKSTGTTAQFFVSQWLVTVICAIGLPQSVVRCLSFKSTHELKRALVLGTIVLGILAVFTAMFGTLIRGIILTHDGPTDEIIPMFVTGYMPGILAGITILGPLAACISTISSLLIDASGTLVKGIYISGLERKGKPVNQKSISRIARITTIFCGVIPFFFALNPPSILLWILQFAFGGLECAFFWTVLLGLFWKKANSTGALCCMIGGNIVFISMYITGIKLGTFHNLFTGIIVALVCFLIGNLFGKPAPENTLRIFFPHKYPEKPL